jgi:hypothetical protein
MPVADGLYVVGDVHACSPLQVRPLEEAFKFGHFFSPLLNESDFSAKPSVLLLGQYSTGMPGVGGRLGLGFIMCRS